MQFLMYLSDAGCDILMRLQQPESYQSMSASAVPSRNFDETQYILETQQALSK